MVLWGTTVNAFAILGGAFLGAVVPFPEQIRKTILNALALVVIIIGISMGLESENILIPIIALVFGGIAGELLGIESKISNLGDRLERSAKRGPKKESLTEGFLTATLVYCVGAMAVIGALNSGLDGNHQVLYAKSMIDGISAIFFSASLGLGVAFSALSVFVYQGVLTLLATYIAPVFGPVVLQEITATGGILILGIGFNMLGLTKIAVGNLLPAIAVALFLALFL